MEGLHRRAAHGGVLPYFGFQRRRAHPLRRRALQPPRGHPERHAARRVVRHGRRGERDSDEGPCDLPGIGGQVVETIVRALFASPAWKDTAVFITYDENGGIADHVPPAPACPPDDSPPHDSNGNRCPAPSTRPASACRSSSSRRTRARTSCRTRSTTTRRSRASSRRASACRRSPARDANATPPIEMFDFKNPPFMTPPDITAKTHGRPRRSSRSASRASRRSPASDAGRSPRPSPGADRVSKGAC